jgi:Rap1a immunity proteins
MRKVVMIATLFAVFGVVPANTATAPFTGNDMLPAYEAANYFVTIGRLPNLSGDMTIRAGYCMGEVHALLWFSQALAMTKGNKPCIPADTTTGQLVSSVVNYLHAHPEDRNLDFELVAMKAINRSWHCGETN